MDLAKAADLLMATIDTLQDFHQDDTLAHLYEHVVSVANLPTSMELSNCKSNQGDGFQVGYKIQFY